jgi:hypothetical protein
VGAPARLPFEATRTEDASEARDRNTHWRCWRLNLSVLSAGVSADIARPSAGGDASRSLERCRPPPPNSARSILQGQIREDAARQGRRLAEGSSGRGAG